MPTTAPPLSLTIVRQGERLFVDLAEVGTLIPRGELRVDDTFLREVAIELRLLATPGFSLRERREGRDSGPVPSSVPDERRTLERLGSLLFSHLFPESVRVRLQAAAPGDLYLRLDEQLLALPWELAYDGQAFLATKFAIGRQVITSQPLPGATCALVSERPLKVLLIVDPTESLPQAAAEVEQLCTLLEEVPGVEVTLVGGKNVRKLSLLAAVQEHAVVHFAGHSVYDPQSPGESGWRLQEGLLTARELGKLTHPPQLVFSNSCHAGATTGWGSSLQDGEQNFGLGGEFLLAGVPNYVGPCWVVDDIESVEFALAFYRQVAAGASLGTALRAARQGSLAGQGRASLAWASYVLYGAPTTLLLPAADVLQPVLAKDSALTVSGSGTGAEVSQGQARPRSQWHRWGLVIGLLLALGVGGFAVVWSLAPSLLVSLQPSSLSQPAPSLPLPDKPSIIVLPFTNMSGDPAQEYFSDGLTEVLTGDLSKLSSLFVIARNSAFTYKGKAVKVQDVGREMGVRYVLEGSVLRAKEQVRITVQLIDATTGYHLWSERYDRPLQDLFQLQDEIVQRIVTTLKLQVTLQERGIRVRKRTDNLEAYDAFLRGMEYAWRFTKDATVQARQMWEKAIVLDPQYAEAYAALGTSYYLEWIWFWNTDPQTLARALALGQQAVALDDSLPGAHSVLSCVYAVRQQFDQAIAEGRRAIALDPNNADSYVALAEALFFAGQPDEMPQLVAQAMRLNPRYPPTYLEELGWGYCLTGRSAEAVATLKETISRSPTHVGAHVGLVTSYVQQWAYQQGADARTLEHALETTHRLIALNDSLPPGHQLLGTVYLWQKKYELAIAEMEKALTLDPNHANGYALLAEVLSRLGRSQEALDAAEKALGLKPYLPDQHLPNVGTAYVLARQPKEAIAPLQLYLRRYPNILGVHLMLAAAYSELGQEAEARAAAMEVLRINPQFSLEVHKERAPIKDPEVLERHLDALRKAGLK